jgi:apolipoprotein N-acyltransferase
LIVPVGLQALRWSSLILGACLYTVAFPPYEWSITAWVALVPLFLFLPTSTPRSAFLAGFLYALLWCMGVGYWVYFTVTDNFTLGFPLNLLFIFGNYAFFVALPTGVIALLSSLVLRRGNPWLRVLGIPTLWVGGEVLRANPAFGVSWGILGYTQYQQLALIQIADVTSVYGVSFLLALGNYVVAELWGWGKAKIKRQKCGETGDWGLETSSSSSSSLKSQVSSLKSQVSSLEKSDAGCRTPWPALGLFAASLLVTLSYGTMRLRHYTAPPEGTPLRVALVLGDIPPTQRWQPAYYASTLLRYVSVTSTGIAGTAPDLIVWPEFAVNFYLDHEPLLQLQLGQFAQMINSALLVGAPRQEEAATGLRYYNSAYLFAATGQLIDIYDKRRLVPFAEYRPFHLPGVLTHNETSPSEFTSGSRSAVFSHPKGALGMMICYEAAFPSVARQLVHGGARVLVNISNDTWLGGLPAATEQHFVMSIFRAVENRRPLIRIATAGISSVVDPSGRLQFRSTIAEGVLHGTVFPRQESTVYTRYGEWFSWLCLGVAVSCFVLAARKPTDRGQDR